MANDFYADPMNLFRAMGAGTGPGSLPMPQMVSADEVHRDAGSRVDNILKNWKLLKGVLDRHEATIQRRWMKKTKKQRLKILLEAWPYMSASHRPDWESLRKESDAQRGAGTRYKDAFMWPYINQDDLSSPRTFLLLLNARGRNHPTHFAAADVEAIHLGVVSKAIVPVFLNEYTMLLNGQEGDEYGKLLSWDDHESAFDWMHTRVQFQPGEGLLILEVQQRLLSFLVDCCKDILHDIDPSNLLSSEYPLLPEPPSKSENGVEGFDALAVMTAEAPYRLPARINFGRIVSLLAARESAAEDHLWLLREDPGYFADRVLTFKEHRQELLSDTRGQKHPLFQLQREHVFWSRVVGGIVSEAYLGLEIFAELRRQAQQLLELEVNYSRIISSTRELPDEYLTALLKFQHYLNQSSKGPINQFAHSLVASPPFRPFFVRDVPPDSITPKIAAGERADNPPKGVQRDLLLLFRTLWEDGQDLFLLRKPDVVSELQRLVEMNHKAREMISDFIGSQLSDLIIICECLRQLNSYQPWANNFEEKLDDKRHDLMQEYEKRTRPWGAMLRALDFPDMGRMGDPSGNKFDYPVARRRNRENVETMRRAEAELDAFWTKIDQMMLQNVGDMKGTAVGQLLHGDRTLRRTAEWVEPVSKGTTKQPSTAVDDLIMPLSGLYFGRDRRVSKNDHFSSVARPKEKVKTRGTPTAPRNDNGQTADQATESIPHDQPTVRVDARALKVFRTLFYTPSLTATPGEIPWADFLHAMKSTGFTAEKLAGSAWQFTPKDVKLGKIVGVSVERGIQFHQPHPVSKIPYRWARRFGRRLERAYGFVGEMFGLEEKKGEGEEEVVEVDGGDERG